MDAKSEIAAELRRWAWPLVLLVNACVWLGTRHAQPGPQAWLHYIALAWVCIAICGWTVRGMGWRRRKVIIRGFAVGILLLLPIYAFNDSYTIEWTRRDDAACTDTYRRWPAALLHRKIQTPQDVGNSWSEGPMVNAQRHGQWRRTYVRPPHFEPEWFWQDNQVSEAEWKRLSG